MTCGHWDSVVAITLLAKMGESPIENGQNGRKVEFINFFEEIMNITQKTPHLLITPNIPKRKGTDFTQEEMASLFQQLTEHLREVFWIASTDWQEIIYISPGYVEIWGRSCDSLYARPLDWLDSVVDADREQVIAAMSAISSGDTSDIAFPEYRIHRPDGSERWIKAHTFTLCDVTGNIRWIAGVAEDITERKQAETGQRESNDFVKALADHIPALLGHWTPELRYTFASKEYTKLLGRSEAEMQGIRIQDLVGDELFRIREPYIRSALRGEPQSFEGTLPKPDGNVLHVLAQYIPHKVDGQVQGVFGLVTDITSIKHDQEQLRVSDAALKAVSQGVVIRGADQFILSANDAFASITGYSTTEIIGRDYCLLVGPLTDPHQAERIRMSFEYGTEFSGDILHYRKDGSAFWNELTISPVHDEQGQLTHFVGITRDITKRKHAEESLRIAAVAFESQEGMMVTDANSVILQVNRALTEITGYMAEEIIGQTPRLFKSGRHNTAFYAAMWDSIKRTGGWHGEIWDRRKNGEIYPKWLAITAVKSEDGAVTHYVGAHTDISTRKAEEDVIKNMAFYDPLTQLPNRHLLNDRLSQAMAASKRSACYGALMLLDLDNFKPLNDTHGHIAGDQLLIKAAERLNKCVREMDTVARFGGDEFIVMLNGLGTDKAESTSQAGIIAEKIRAALSEPYLLTIRHNEKADATVEHHCSASVGVTLFFNYEASYSEILKKADMAMYQAKKAGRNLIRFHDSNI
ncbi:MAG: PAS domain S-box protein [Gammaproteobacteria bacterium]|nr:PAS domain S-box protein [Gammaproteobacteria bacterium]MBU1730823.1 PAS domain S-box protein [Gammaproteobacteria bacterium]MBU1891369.1 PAS domain S-box protein [Gammaproteobacteria bacterium]